MKRDPRIDVLKVIGLLCIILAHVDPPIIIFQIRNFDVVLMVLISSYLGIISYNKTNFLKYVKKRFGRLILPVYLFLIFFFIISYLFNILQLDIKTIAASFLLYGGIGYVWIIRIYFLIALLIPLYLFVDKKINKYIHLIVLIIAYIEYEILCYYGVFNNSFLQYLLAYIIPCYLLLYISKSCFEFANKKVAIISLVSLIIFGTIGFYIYKTTGVIQPTQIMKYPFRLYYLSYGLFMSSILIMLLNNEKICNKLSNKLTVFISSNSLWIYLWHILAIFILKKFNISWIIQYILIMVFSLTITYIQSLIVRKIENDRNKNIIKVFKG